jgi:ArsR family transcriptional regulator
MLNYFSECVPASPVNLEILADRLKVLAEPKRLLIFNLLMEGVQCNCELGDYLEMPPNLISHHLSKLRAAGLVDAERDPIDSRWVYYSVNRAALEELNAAFGTFFDTNRIKPRRNTCGPKNLITASELVEAKKR